MKKGKLLKLSVPQWPYLQNRKDDINLRGLFGQRRVSVVAQMVKDLPAMWETWVRSLGREDPLEKNPMDRGVWQADIVNTFLRILNRRHKQSVIL